MCCSVHVCTGVPALIPLKLELEAVVSHLM